VEGAKKFAQRWGDRTRALKRKKGEVNFTNIALTNLAQKPMGELQKRFKKIHDYRPATQKKNLKQTGASQKTLSESERCIQQEKGKKAGRVKRKQVASEIRGGEVGGEKELVL